ncbi:MAG: fimbrial assembly protein [Fusobacterium gastrosuis]|uniref:fimbrial assembly protein n=1 Tax=Fusobacterium gastrosuis TaxID=1755100 RepID=UPI002A8AAEE2|nr:fimbrial assembly protein [Fusobacterium gastrosuis]
MIKNLFPIIYIKDFKLNQKEKVVLCLENYYFNIFKLKIDNIINQEDRISKIEEHLEIHFPRYNSSNFVLRYEYLEKNKNSEVLLVYLFDLEKLKISYDFEKNNLKILSIIPSFMLCRNYKGNKNFFNFDISEQGLVVSKYENEKLTDFTFYQNDASFIIDNNHEFNSLNFTNTINTHLKNINSDFEIIFTGKKIDTTHLDLLNKTFSFLNIQEIDLRKYLNFLPNELQKKYVLYYINLKYLICIFVSMIIFIFSTIFLYYKISILEKQLNEIEVEINLLAETNEDIRNKIANIEEDLTKLELEIKNKITVNFNVGDLFKELQYITPKNIKISSIEYDGKKIINILGSSISLTDIYTFLDNIQNSEKLVLENYDYILKSQNELDFKFELSLKN